MSKSLRPLTRADIAAALTEIGNTMRTRGIEGNIRIIGGTAMILSGLAVRETTVDVDAVSLKPIEGIMEIARDIGARHGWGDDWLNIEARGLNPQFTTMPLWNSIELGEGSLSIELATPGALLAMKLNASRPGKDEEDLEALMSHHGYTTLSEADDHFEEYFAGESMPDKAVHLLRIMGYADGNEAMYRSIPIPEQLLRKVAMSGKATGRTCGVIIQSTGLPCIFPPHPGSYHRSR